MPHLKLGTKVTIARYAHGFNGLHGIVEHRDGEYYNIRITTKRSPVGRLYGLYLCELDTDSGAN